MIAIAIAFLAGLGLGYALGWNRAAHPGKVEAQLGSLEDAAKGLADDVKDKVGR